MPQRSRGLRSKTRYTLQKKPRNRGELPPNRVLRNFEIGSRVAIVLEPSQQKGMAHPRFQGETGVVDSRQGEAFVVKITSGNKPKTLVVRAEHLRQVQ